MNLIMIPQVKAQYCAIFSPEWVKTWVGSLPKILHPTISLQKRKKRPEIERFQVFYGLRRQDSNLRPPGYELL